MTGWAAREKKRIEARARAEEDQFQRIALTKKDLKKWKSSEQLHNRMSAGAIADLEDEVAKLKKMNRWFI